VAVSDDDLPDVLAADVAAEGFCGLTAISTTEKYIINMCAIHKNKPLT